VCRIMAASGPQRLGMRPTAGRPVGSGRGSGPRGGKPGGQGAQRSQRPDEEKASVRVTDRARKPRVEGHPAVAVRVSEYRGAARACEVRRR
jgi:hypothetical protein